MVLPVNLSDCGSTYDQYTGRDDHPELQNGLPAGALVSRRRPMHRLCGGMAEARGQVPLLQGLIGSVSAGRRLDLGQ